MSKPSDAAMSIWRPQISKKMREYVRRETKTTERTLEDRRDRLQVRIGTMIKLMEIAHSDTADEAEKARALNASNSYGMLGLLEGVAFLADCVSHRVFLKKKDPDGTKKKVPVRYSVAMLADDMAGCGVDTAVLLDSLNKIVRDQVLMGLDEEHKKSWFDENGLLRCPHYSDAEDADDGPTQEELEKLEAEDRVRVAKIAEEENAETLERVKAKYVEGKKP